MTDPNSSTNETELAAVVLDEQNASNIVAALKVKLSKQVAPSRWQGSLERLAAQLDEGASMEEAIASQASKMPGELRCLLSESLRVKDPATFLVDSLKTRKEVRASWHDLFSLCMYPLFLVLFAIVVGVAFSYTMKYAVDTKWIEELGLRGVENIEVPLSDQHHAMIGLATIVGWCALILATIYLAGPPWAWLAVMGGVILVGKPLRWLTMQEILCRYQLFLTQGVPLQEASWAVSRSFASSSQAIVSRAIASRVQDGMPLGRAFASSMLSDGVCRPILFLMDEKSEDLPVALGGVTELLGKMVERRCKALGSLLPVFMLLCVGIVIWSAFVSYTLALIPLIQMIQSFAVL